MKMYKLTMVIIVVIFFTTVLASASVSGQDDEKTSKEGVFIGFGDYESEMFIGLEEDEEIEVTVTVTSPVNGKVDVYILSSSEYHSRYPTKTFYPALAKENITTTTFTFECPDDQTYYLVIDNEDNARANDAVPTGSVTVDYEYDDPFAATLKDIEEGFWAVWWMCIAGVVIAVVIVVVIIVLIFYFLFKKDKPPQYPAQYQQYPQAQIGYPGYPQQPYQGPPQQPPSPPPPQQPQ
jgi:hypothetical protein